jgi:phosphoglycolate phosphatase-like HAD superfamily hydrolase
VFDSKISGVIMPNLVLFDIDGTLVNSNEVDAICYVRSVQEEFGLEKIDDRWETYKHATDSGIFEEIFERFFSRKPSEPEISRTVARLVRLLAEYHSRKPAMFDEIGGAGETLQMLKCLPDWRIGIATGAWKESASFKLNSAGIKYEGLPIVTGSDAKTREEILLKCVDASKNQYGIAEFEKIVSVGDAVWDLKTASNLKLGFIGINKPEKFKDYKDCRVMQDFSNRELFMQYLEEALVPRIP